MNLSNMSPQLTSTPKEFSLPLSNVAVWA
ncbi:MAG: hypothetical protein QOC64_2479, partial [Solirubrobacteraceae bacterium]|nr:hypothetical protein [Solirubrobacteraceae bacterium]